MARPAKMTPELVGELARHLEAGNFIATACRAVGVAPSTFYAWKARAEKDETLVELVTIIRRAEATAEVEALDAVRRGAEKDWRAAAWFLSHRYPEKWGNLPRQIEGPDGAQTSEREQELRELVRDALEAKRNPPETG